MGNLANVIGIALAAVGLIFTWVKLRPSERRRAKTIGLKAWRFCVNLGIFTFFLWSNYYFFAADGPPTRTQILLILIVYAEMLAVAVLFVVGRILDRIILLQERIPRTTDKRSLTGASDPKRSG